MEINKALLDFLIQIDKQILANGSRQEPETSTGDRYSIPIPVDRNIKKKKYGS